MYIYHFSNILLREARGNGIRFCVLKIHISTFNIQKMDRFSYEASFFDLRSQITDALDKCTFLRPIREVFGLQNADLDLSDDEISDA